MPGKLVERIWESQPHIHAPVRHRRACKYAAFVPDELGSLELSLPVELAGALSEADAAIRELNAAAQPALAPLARLLLRTESIASSKVEGLQMGVRELVRAEVRLEMGGRRSRTAIEIVANISAMELAVTEAAAAARFGEAELLAIHRQLMENDPRRGIAGRFRTEQNWIGGNDYTPCGADFVPPPVEEVPRLLEDMYAAINDDQLPPLVQAALVHAQFETIHPFDDGNGRTGRALVHVILRRRGVAPAYVPPISVILANSRERYIAGLTQFRGNGTIEWIAQFAEATTRSARLAGDYLNKVGRLMATWRDRIAVTSNPRAGAAVWEVLDVLPAHPVITGPVAAAATGRSKGPIYEAINQLVVAGVLIPVSGSKRNQSWEAEGLTELLEELEEGGRLVPQRPARASKEPDRKVLHALRRERAELIVNRFTGLSSRIVETTSPIYQASDRGLPDPLASGILLELGHARYVLTATHVIQKLDKRELGIATTNELMPLRGERVVLFRQGAISPDEDDIDVTAIRVASGGWLELPSSAFLQWDELDYALPRPSRDSFAMTGFPISKQPGGARSGEIAAYAYQALAKEAPLSAYEAEGRDPHATLILGFDRRRIWGPEGMLTAPDMYGMSGSGMWRIGPNVWEVETSPRLSAIITEWRPKGRYPHILGTRIRHIVGALCSHDVEVRDFVTRKLGNSDRNTIQG